MLFLGLGAAGFYVTIAKNNPNLGVLVALGLWALAVVVLFITMITSDYE